MYESTHAMYAGASDSQKLSSSVELTLFAEEPEEVGVTITGATDGPAGNEPATTTFTVYVVEANLDVTTNSIDFTAGGLTNGNTSADDSDDPQIDANFTPTGGTTDNIPMRYQVSGPGRVYVQIGERKTSATSTLDTSSAAPVFLDMNGGTNRVTVSVPSAAVEYPAIYIFGRPSITITNGDDQEGIASGQLDEYLAVEVKDARGRTVPDLPVTFTTGGSGMFTPVSGMLYGEGREEADADTVPLVSPQTIYTDSRGEAKTYYQLGATGVQDVTATLQSRFTPSQTFEATIGTGTRRPSIAIFSGNNQRTDENGDIEDPLVVAVRMGGNLKPNELVEFRTIKGTLSGFGSDGTTITTAETAKRVYDLTDGNGQAEVEYFQEPGSGSDTVTATISDTNYEREVTFAINGASVRSPTTTPTPTPTPTPTTPTLTLSSTTLTGTAGSNVPLAATVQNPAGNVQGFGVTFTLSTTNSGAVSPSIVLTNANGVAPTTVTLPNTNAQVTVTANVGVTSLTEQPALRSRVRLLIQVRGRVALVDR